MLDAETKRRIDSCRDILVGKVPDPKSQVEQITIALIYKFMDDMDAEAEELGGQRTFFAGEYARYGWAKLMAPSLGGFEVLGLYSEAIQKMNENPGVPELFRDIFKNAYLPYRDPETLKSFLKEINYFTYDHSERLGDAFEYLLSVLGSQGDAGQFRTPRHIIDFMVEVLAPQKNETILDPACGTAGFLISAWKHILKANTDKTTGDKLTPDERARLAANIRGYDISPDMVRLSLVNLYLHGFSDPHIVEYDTLTQDDKWNEVADVILANPPFMSPKGGIKPHKRFSVQATRSEVLFVDYMAEHLTATGRAAIVVPEGIIFQSGTAYKALREMLVKTSLVAVVSLPAGVFNPYSGVKTSILFMDKRVHKQTDKVLFVKVQNDGFNLGAQRRAVSDSHLPEATRLLRTWMTTPDTFVDGGVMAQAVNRLIISESGDCNLSAERYKVAAASSSAYRTVTLRDISVGKPEYGSGARRINFDGEVRYVRITDIEEDGRLKEADAVSPSEIEPSLFLQKGDLLFARSGSVGRCYLHRKTEGKHQFAGYLIRFHIDSSMALPEYVFWATRSSQYNNWIEGVKKSGTISNINAQEYAEFELPLPPIEVQHRIVAEIEGYQRVIDGVRQILDSYRPNIAVSPDWPMLPLEDVCEIQRGKFSHRPRNDPRFYGGKYPFIQTGDIVRALGGKISYTQTLNEEGLLVSKIFQPPLVVVTIAANIGDTAVLDFPSCFPDSVVGLTPNAKMDVAFLELMMRLQKGHLNNIAPQAAQKNINIEILKTLVVPCPELATQKSVVAEISAEQALVQGNLELKRRMEAKVKAAIDRVWGTQFAATGL